MVEYQRSTDTGILHRNLTVGFICELNLRGLLGSQRRGCRLPRFIQRGGRASLANPENYTLELNAEINQTFNFGLDTDIRIVSFFVPDIKWHTVAVLPFSATFLRNPEIRTKT